MNKIKEVLLETDVFTRAQNGDEEAFGKIYDAYFDPIFRFIFFRTSHHETAEDLTEEVFIKAYRSLGGLHGGEEKLQGWLYTIARHTVIDHYRKHTTDHTVPLEELEALPDYAPTALDMLSLEADQQILVSALQKLPGDQQAVIKLRFIEGFEITEIAAMLEKSEGNVRIIQFRALQKLRTLLTPEKP